MNRRRVLLISVRADPGGGPKHIADLIRLLPAWVDAYVACPREKPYWGLYSELVGQERLQEIPHRAFSWRALIKLLKFARANRIEVVHSHGKGAGIYGRLVAWVMRCRCIHTYHGIHLGSYGYFQRWAYIVMERTLSLFTHRLVAVSASEAEWASQLRLCPAGKLVTIANGVAMPEFLPASTNGGNSPFTILSSSWFNQQKNSEMLLPIMQILQKMGQGRQLRFVVIGDGEARGSLERDLRAQVPAMAIEFAGVVDNPAKFMRSSSCFLSTSRWEGLPYAILEAMAYALPVVATDVTGNRDLVEHQQTGLLFALDRPEQAASAILSLADNPELARSMGCRGRLRVQAEFGLERMALQISSLYEEGSSG
jgi:glycosyltransferase involved in cell wall biosynthesis